MERSGAEVPAGARPPVRSAACRVPELVFVSAPVPMRAAAAALPAASLLVGGPSGQRVASQRARPGHAGAARERHEFGAAPRLAAPRPV